MDYEQALEILGLEDRGDLTKDHVRRTYMRKLREYSPEKDPDGFRRVREAFELIRAYVVDPAPEHDPDRVVFVVRAEGTRPTEIDRDEVDDDDDEVDDDDDDNGTSYRLDRDDLRSENRRWKRDEQPAHRDDDDDDDDDDVDDGDDARDANDDQPRMRWFRLDRHGKSQPVDDGGDGDDDDGTYRLDKDEVPDNGPSKPRARNGESTYRLDRDDAPGGGDSTYSLDRDDVPDNDRHERDDDDDDDGGDSTYRLDKDEIHADDEDDDDNDDDNDDDGDGDGDQSYETDDDDVELAEPGMPLPALVEKILVLLEHEEVEEAIALQGKWKDDADSDDHRRTDPMVAARWALTRELLAVAPLLPAKVVSPIAAGIAADDIASARPALEAFRRQNFVQAQESDTLLRSRAKDLHRPIDGALYVEPPPTYVTDPPSISASSGSGGGFNAFWIVAVIILAVIKFAARSGSDDDSYSTPRYTPSYDSERMREMQDQLTKSLGERYRNDRYGTDGLGSEPLQLKEPGPVQDTESYTVLLRNMEQSVDIVLAGDSITFDQRDAIGQLSVDIRYNTCKEIRASLANAEEIPPLDNVNGAVADRHLKAIRERADLACPAKTPKKAKTKKSPKKKAPAAEPQVESPETP